MFSIDDGTQTVTDLDIANYMTYLNDLFLEYRFQFSLFELVRQENTIVNHASIADWQNQTTFQQQFGMYQTEMVNVFVTNDLDGSQNGIGTLPVEPGTYDQMVSEIELGTIIVTNSYLLPSTSVQNKYNLPHELGHVFGLFHTFENMFPCENECREEVAPNSNGGGINPYRGDLIADTHPSPHPIL